VDGSKCFNTCRSFSQFGGNYISISGGTSLGTSTNDDDNFGTLPIGFPFDFNGVTYTDFGVNANGFITLEEFQLTVQHVCHQLQQGSQI